MRVLCLISLLFGGVLAAETIGNVEFQFPPSIYPWTLLTDTNAFVDEEDDIFAEMKVYTHRAGDALELFVAYASSNEEDDYESQQWLQTLGFLDNPDLAEQLINHLIMPYFPNHQLSIGPVGKTDQGLLFAWGINDGFQPIMHGLSRVFTTNEQQICLNYVTTAAKGFQNSDLWVTVLSEAR